MSKTCGAPSAFFRRKVPTGGAVMAGRLLVIRNRVATVPMRVGRSHVRTASAGVADTGAVGLVGDRLWFRKDETSFGIASPAS